MKSHSIIVPGGLNTDIVGLGVDRILKSGELTLGGKLKIGAGGKARNMAQMAAAYLGKNTVAMIGRTVRDPFGLWQVPVNALSEAGVDTRHVRILEYEHSGNKYPGIALIPVDKTGRNQIYVLPGVNADFSAEDIDAASALFESSQQKKVLILALEIPLETVRYAIERAWNAGIPVVLDPGGISVSPDDILNEKIFLLKPNEHEAKIITGVTVRNFEDARRAAERIQARGITYVMITHGIHGAYLFGPNTDLHIPIPDIEGLEDEVQDETGCGDQVTAIMAAALATGKTVEEAAQLAVKAGTLQFHRAGIQPVDKEKL